MTNKELEKIKHDFWEKIRPKTELEIAIEKMKKIVDKIINNNNEHMKETTKKLKEFNKAMQGATEKP